MSVKGLGFTAQTKKITGQVAMLKPAIQTRQRRGFLEQASEPVMFEGIVGGRQPFAP